MHAPHYQMLLTSKTQRWQDDNNFNPYLSTSQVGCGTALVTTYILVKSLPACCRCINKRYPMGCTDLQLNVQCEYLAPRRCCTSKCIGWGAHRMNVQFVE